MSDDDKKDEAEEKAEEAADKAEEAKEEAVEAKEEAKKVAEEAKEAVEEVKEAVKEPARNASPARKDSVSGGHSDAGGEKVEKAKEEKPSVKVSPALEKIIKTIEELSVLELSELVKALEVRFGVSAAAPVAVATAGGTAGGDEGASEQTTFNVILADSGANKISVIKAVREIVPTLGLKEAKDLVDTAPKPVVEGVNKENAQEAKTKLEAAGAKVELK